MVTEHLRIIYGADTRYILAENQMVTERHAQSPFESFGYILAENQMVTELIVSDMGVYISYILAENQMVTELRLN